VTYIANLARRQTSRPALAALIVLAVTAQAMAATYSVNVGAIKAKWDDVSGANFSGTGITYLYDGQVLIVLPSGYDSIKFSANCSAENTSWWWSRDFKFQIRVTEVKDGNPPYIDATTAATGGFNIVGLWGKSSGTVTSPTVYVGTGNWKIFRVAVYVEIVNKKNSGWIGKGFPVFKYPSRICGLSAYRSCEWIHEAYQRRWAFEALYNGQLDITGGSWISTDELWYEFINALGDAAKDDPVEVGFWGVQTLHNVFNAFIAELNMYILTQGWRSSWWTQLLMGATNDMRLNCASEQGYLERLFYSLDDKATKISQVKSIVTTESSLLAKFGNFSYSGTTVYGKSGEYIFSTYLTTQNYYLMFFGTKITDPALGTLRSLMQYYSNLIAADQTIVNGRTSDAGLLY
jgi:hypothetical protein